MQAVRAILAEKSAAFAARHEVLGATSLPQFLSSLTDADYAALAAGLERQSWKYRGMLLHSERNPQREAERVAVQFKNAEALICISIGAGYLLNALANSVRSILLVEPNAYCLAAFLISGEVEKYRGKLTLFADTLVRADALEEILPWLQGKNLKRTLIYTHAPLLESDKVTFTRAVERVVQLFEKRSVNQATIIKFQQLWNKNILLNQRYIAKARPLNALYDFEPPRAIVLAGAGPSLTASLVDLKRYRERYVLFAADTALVPLGKGGVFPDFVFSADPQWLNHYFAHSNFARRTAWVMDPVVCPAIGRFVEACGSAAYFWNNAFLMDTVFRTIDRGDVAHGGSVTTNAFDVAVRWLSQAKTESPARLILVGQDLSFSNKQAHAKGAVLESRIFTNNNRVQSMEQHNFRQLTALPALPQAAIAGGTVPTNHKLKIFLDWFCARAAEVDKARIRLVNATKAGAFLRGFEHISLGEALADLPQAPTRDEVTMNVRTNDLTALPKIQNDLLAIEQLMQESARLAEKSPADSSTIALLNRNDARFKALSVAKDVAALNAQALILKITEQGEAVDAPKFYRAMAHSAREVRHWSSKL
ncbi:MAG: motility associated factor glycosyltransferase family protein [Spirochaetes bacterium]|nr:motility associated factor glycosyltransferase family protein [Spirochaetota bacterium]